MNDKNREWSDKVTKAGRKEMEREIRRKDIIDAAEKLFFSKGYENVAMIDIANEAEMARGTLYQYFKNKNDIYAAIAIRAVKILNEMFQKINQKDLSGIEKIKSLSSTYYQFYKKYTGYYKAYYHSGTFDNSSPNLEKLKNIRRKSFNVIVGATKEGINDGTIRDDIDPEATALIMLLISNDVTNIIPVTRMYMEDYGLTQDVLFERSLELVVRSIEKVR